MTQNELIGFMVGYFQKSACEGENPVRDGHRVDGTEGEAAIDCEIEAADNRDQTRGTDKSIERVGFTGGQPRSEQSSLIVRKTASDDEDNARDNEDDSKEKKDEDENEEDKDAQDSPQPPPTVGSQWQDSVTDHTNL